MNQHIELESKLYMKNKILFLLHVPPPVHGSSIVGLNIKESLLLNDFFDCKYVNLLISRKNVDTGKFSVAKFFSQFKVILNLFYYLISFKPEICYFALTVNGFALYRDVILVLIIKFFRIPIVFHLHNKGIKNQNSNLKKTLFKYIFKNSKVIVLSPLLYGDIESYVAKDSVYVCANGLKDVAKKRINTQCSESENIRVLFLSNLIASKGVNVLLEACSILHQNGHSFTCSFVGNEGDVLASDFQASVVNLGLDNLVIYKGPKYDEDKSLEFKESDLFVFPTHYKNECLPLVLIEAMQFSLPIISTHEGGISDMVTDGINGFLISPNDAVDLAKKIECFILNPELKKKFGVASRKKYEEFYTLESFNNRLLEILKNVINKK